MKPIPLESLREQIGQIAELTTTVPEQFRQKCFELLMHHLLGASSPAFIAPSAVPGVAVAAPELPGATQVSPENTKPRSPLLAAFLKKSGVSTERFAAVVSHEAGRVRFLREPKPVRSAQFQIEMALLLALKNAIIQRSFVVDAEEVRVHCQEKGVLDRRNFFPNFRRFADYFRSAPAPDGKPQPLSSKGIAALSLLIKSLADAP